MRLREWLGIAAIITILENLDSDTCAHKLESSRELARVWDEIQKRQEAQKALSSAVEDLRASLDTSKSETSALAGVGIGRAGRGEENCHFTVNRAIGC